MRRFLASDPAPGVALVAATVAALVWINSPAADAYTTLWDTAVGPASAGMHLDLRHWVNDALMTVFFFVIGLELKQELVDGELAHPRAAALPVLAAVGGALVPAVVFLMVTFGTPAARGWGVPMATDPAFAVGVLALVARRVPPGVRLLLLAIATVDDVLAVLVIAAGYSGALSWPWLAAAVGGCLLVVVLRRLGVSAIWPYLPVGAAVWYATLQSGAHATLAGVALALLTPAGSTGGRDVLAVLLRRLAPVSAFLAVPVFALANAGVPLSADSATAAFADRVTWAILAGLLFGKFAGITGTITLVTRTGLGHLPSGVTSRHVAGLGLLGALGFTVALFVTELAYTEAGLTDHAKIGILAASVIAAAAAALVLTRTPQEPTASPAATGDDTPGTGRTRTEAA
ncbi:Na+/H+ antiporter NhaA [Actinacidiphila oryziradicis]|uniref:Na+/H+ antiporter NhaA n=1 Tax=Actinacidiphila oryziradicis TaxID=2571141 RepID=UPI001B804EBB|nr:Na+/H+ antiporter NhaA [Actinacidiphila oryziradicis]